MLQAAAKEVAESLGGSLDNLIANAGYISRWSGYVDMPTLYLFFSKAAQSFLSDCLQSY